MQGKIQACLHLYYGHFKFEQDQFKKEFNNNNNNNINNSNGYKKSVHRWYGSSPNIKVKEGN